MQDYFDKHIFPWFDVLPSFVYKNTFVSSNDELHHIETSPDLSFNQSKVHSLFNHQKQKCELDKKKKTVWKVF